MADMNVKSTAKNGLPVLIVAVLCGYATNAIPDYFPIGEFRDWAYRSVPFLSLMLLFFVRTLMDFGGMSFTSILFAICANPEKERLKTIMLDTHASENTKAAAKNEYDSILKQEMEIGSRLRTYISQWTVFKKAPTPPPAP